MNLRTGLKCLSFNALIKNDGRVLTYGQGLGLVRKNRANLVGLGGALL